MRGGFRFADIVGMELVVGIMPVSTSDGRSGLVVPFHGDLIFYPVSGIVTPYIAAGVGAYALLDGDLGSDADLLISVRAGARFRIARMWSLRVEVQGLLTDPVSDTIAPNVAFSGGLDVLLGTAPPDEEPPGDLDGDGVLDREDSCPKAPGPARLDGCPDTDLDGIADRKDACPETAGLPVFHGCPDTDGDGLPDTVDACPTLAGVEAFSGCPDSDDDGIPDGQDACPRIKGAHARKGCPSVPAEVAELFGRPLDGVSFAPKSSALRPSSSAALIRLADRLQAHPYLRVEIQGHSHNRGRRNALYALTKRRAEAVRARLTELGVEARRLRSVGLGADQPVASNRSRDGRARNERVEIHLID